MSLLNHLSLLKMDWNYEILGTQYFSDNWKLAGITPVYKKKDPTFDTINHERLIAKLYAYGCLAKK